MDCVMKRVMSFCFALFFFLPGGVFAKEYNFPTGMLIGDEKGISVSRDGRYFIVVEDIRPGDRIHKTLVIRNNEPGTSFQLTMSSLPIRSEGPEDLLEKIQMRLMLDGMEIYRGRLRGDQTPNITETPLSLGNYPYDTVKTMEILLIVDEDLKIMYEASVAEIQWEFVANKIEIPATNAPTDPKRPSGTSQSDGWQTPGEYHSPKTGIYVNFTALLCVFLLAITALVLLLRLRKQRHIAQQKGGTPE